MRSRRERQPSRVTWRALATMGRSRRELERSPPYVRGKLCRGRRAAGSCTGVHRECRQSPHREGPRHNRDYDDVECYARKGRLQCVTRPGEAEYAVSVGVFRHAGGRGRIAFVGRAVVVAKLEGSPACIGGGICRNATDRSRRRDALQQKGKGQHNGGKLPAHARQPMQPPNHRQSFGPTS